MWRLMFFIKLEVFGHYFLKYSFFPFLFLPFFWDSRYAYIGTVDGISTGFWDYVYFSLLFLLLFLKLDNLHWHVSSSSLFLSSVCSNLLLSISHEIFISIIILFNSRICLIFKKIIYISLLIISIWGDNLILSFSSLDMVSCSSLNIFIYLF